MDFLEARTNMVLQQVRPWLVSDEAVLAVLNEIPRELFVPKLYNNLAYTDTEIPLAEGQLMLCPRVVGRALQALTLSPNDKVLEIGTGSGYVTACLSRLVGKITSVEIYASLLREAEKNVSRLSCRGVVLEEGNAALGWESMAPYDVIIATGSYPVGVPQKVREQLSPNGGRLFAICGEGANMQATLIQRQDELYRTEILFETSVPALLHAPRLKNFEF